MQQLEAEFKLEKVEELAKAELTATIASEKAAQIERIAEANLHVRCAWFSVLSLILILIRYICRWNCYEILWQRSHIRSAVLTM